VLRDLGDIHPADAKVILAANKMDLNPYAKPDEWKVGDLPIVPLSAINDMNIQYLIEGLGELVKKDIPADIPMISSARHYYALDRAESRLREVVKGLQVGDTTLPAEDSALLTENMKLPTEGWKLPTEDWKLPTEFLAQDIRQALYHLSEITGEISSEDILGNIFGRFCIGK
jgi:tRNA modification GTPase